jgi:hypothetical protein
MNSVVVMRTFLLQKVNTNTILIIRMMQFLISTAEVTGRCMAILTHSFKQTIHLFIAGKIRFLNFDHHLMFLENAFLEILDIGKSPKKKFFQVQNTIIRTL